MISIVIMAVYMVLTLALGIALAYVTVSYGRAIKAQDEQIRDLWRVVAGLRQGQAAYSLIHDLVYATGPPRVGGTAPDTNDQTPERRGKA